MASWRFGLCLAAGLVLAMPAAASAKNSIHVHGPTTNTLGASFSETVSGHASGAANYVASGEQFNKGAGCAKTYKAERLRSDFTPWPTGTAAVHGNFSLVARFGASNAGTHGICSYLIHRSNKKTYAHAGLFWTNKTGTTTPTGGKLQPSPVGQGQCQARSFGDGSVSAQFAIQNTSCGMAEAVAVGSDTAKGAAYTSNSFSCSATQEGPGSPWASSWTGTYYAYSCQNGNAQVAFNWGMNYSFSG